MVEQIPFVVTGKADFAPVYAQIEALRLKMIQLSNQTVGTGFSKEALAGMANAEASFLKTIKSTQALQLETVKLSSATDHLTSQLVKGKFASSDYFKMWKSGAQGVQPELEKIAKAQAKIAESAVIPSSTRQGYAHIITDTQGIANATRVATIQQLAYNKAMIDASTRMLNFGKNVQWAGRQLTVGLTMPIAAAGAALGDMYYQFDKNIQMLERVYGMGGAAGQAYSKALPTPQQLTDIRNKIMDVSKAMAETYGQSAKVTAEVAVGLAQAGYMGDQLVNLTKTATQAIVLGQTDQQSAIKATISLQTAYKLSIGETADAMNFFAAAHAATSTTMADLINAIPRVGPVVANLGGTYKDTVALLAAMKQGGVSVTDGANALKTSLTRLIVPTNTAQKALAAFGIDIKGIVNRNAGDLLGTITELQTGLMKLTPLAREQAITDMFGKYQVARMTALFQNFNTAGSQSAKVMGMMGLSSKELAGIAAQQTDVLQQSQAGKAKIAWASLQANLLPIGQKFLTVGVAVLQFVDKIVKGFNKLGAIKYVILGALGGAAILGPLIMLGGLLTNLIAQIFKISQTMRIMGTGFSQANGWAKPFQGLTGAMKAFGQTFTVIDKAQLASIELADVMTGTMMTQEELLKHYTLAIQRYSDAIGGIRLSTGAVTEQMAAQETVRTTQIATSSSRLAATKAVARNEILAPYISGRVVKTPTGGADQGRMRIVGPDGALGTGVEFSHLTPYTTNVEGSNVLSRGTNPNARLGAMGNVAMHPGYLVDEAGYGKEFNQRLQQRSMPILPVGTTSEQSRSVMGGLYSEQEMNSNSSKVAAFRSQFAQETVMASETARLSTIKMLAMLSKTDLAEYTKIVGTEGNVAAEDVTAFLQTKLPQDWQRITEATSREIALMYDSATSDAEAYFAKTGKVPASEFERLGVITSAFGEDLRVTLLETINQTNNGLLELITINTTLVGDALKSNMTDTLKRNLGPGLTLLTTQSEQIAAIALSGFTEMILEMRVAAEAVATKFAVAGAEAGVMGGVSGVTGTVGMAGKFTPKFAGGGHVAGPGTGTSDDIPAMLSNGEYVVRASAVNQYGKGFMDQLNAKKFAGGGIAHFVDAGAVADETGSAPVVSPEAFGAPRGGVTSADSLYRVVSIAPDDALKSLIEAFQFQDGSPYGALTPAKLRDLSGPQLSDLFVTQASHFEQLKHLRTAHNPESNAFVQGSAIFGPESLNQIMTSIQKDLIITGKETPAELDRKESLQAIVDSHPLFKDAVERGGQFKTRDEALQTKEVLQKIIGPPLLSVRKRFGSNEVHTSEEFEDAFKFTEGMTKGTVKDFERRLTHLTKIADVVKFFSKDFLYVRTGLADATSWVGKSGTPLGNGQGVKRVTTLPWVEEAKKTEWAVANGAYISGPGGPTDDKIPAYLSNGEYVLNADSVNHYGTGFIDAINAQKFAKGGKAQYGNKSRPMTPRGSAAYVDSGIISTSNVFIDPNMQTATEGFTTALKDATNATMKSTQATNQSVLAGNSFEPNAGNPAEEGKKSRFKMGGMGGMGSMIGGQMLSGIMGTMASNMQGKGPSAAGQAMGDASTGMMMGSMAGWPGMLIGTALGGVFGLIKGHLDELKRKEVSRQNEIAGAYNMSADAASTLGLAVHNLGSVNLPLLTSKIQINDSVVQKLAASYSSSSDAGTKELVARVGGESAALKKLQDAQAQQQKDQGSQPNRFSSMTAASDASAVAKATAEYQAAGAASNNELNKNFLTTMLATGSTKVAGESYAGLAQAGGKSGFGVTTNISQLQQQYSGINGQSKALGDLINSASGDSKALGDIMNNVITSVSPDKWNAIAGASTKAGAALWDSANSFANLQNQIVATNPELSKYTDGLNQMGVSTGDIATAVNLYANNAFSSINEFVNAAANSQLLKGYQAAASQNTATSAASNITSLGVSSLGSAATSGTSGGSGTSTSTEGIQQSIQDQIRSITNEMDARNANTAVVQAQINSGTTLADLQNKIAQAQGTGNLTAISAAQEQYAQQVSTQATVITDATQNAADAQTVHTLEQNLATAATHKTNAQMQTLIQKQIKSLTREIDVRNRNTTLLNNQIQQQETLMNLQNDVVKSQGSGDLLGAALAQTKVNNELNKQTVTNSNDAANYRDTQIQSLLQDQIVALQAIATTAGAGNSSAGTAGGVTSAQQDLIDSAGTAFTDLTNILKTSALDLKPGTTNITGTSNLAARARDDVAAIIKGGYDPKKLGKSMATEIKNSPLKTQMSKSDQSSYQTMFNTVSDAMWKANMPLTEIQGKMETLAQTPSLLVNMIDLLKPIARTTAMGPVATFPGATITAALAAVLPAVDPNKIQQWSKANPMPVKVMDAADIAAAAAKDAADKAAAAAKAATAAAIANLPPGWMARHQRSNLAGATGGFMQAFANGSLGSVRGAGSGISDSIPAMLSHGEYVVKASSVSKLGVGVLDMINQGIMPTYKTPGAKIAVPSSSQMGNSTSSKNIQYNVNVNVAGTNASADEIAKVVISTIKAREGANLTRRSIS